MNIFVLDYDPTAAAQALCDKHIVKMALESTQLLCTAAYTRGFPAPYKPTHIKHPCTIWLLQGRDNVAWLVSHTGAMFAEYTRRYGREHASGKVLRALAEQESIPGMLATLPSTRTPFAQAMPDKYRQPDAVLAYRAYYIGEKARFATWKHPACPPSWWPSSRTPEPVQPSPRSPPDFARPPNPRTARAR